MVVEQNQILNFDVLQTLSELGRPFNAEAEYKSLDGHSCTCGSYCDNVRGWLLLSGVMLDSCIRFFLGYYLLS